MTCINPITVWRHKAWPINIQNNEEKLKKYRKISFHKLKDGEELKIPCGKCIGCKLDHANMWATRIMEETKIWKNAIFVTLTYAEKKTRENGTPCLPHTKLGIPTLFKRDVQLFVKKLRKNYQGIEEWINPITKKIEKPIRYFYCGEYGEKNKRPHYHMIIWNWKPQDMVFYKNSDGSNMPLWTSKKLQNTWGLGFTPIGTVTYESACYIARYVQKKAGLEPKKRKYAKEPKIEWKNDTPIFHNIIIKDPNEKEEEFICMSRGVGIGLQSWIENKEKFKRNNGIPQKTENGLKIKPIPRYYKKKWEEENQEELDNWKYKCQKMAELKQKEIKNNYNFVTIKDEFNDIDGKINEILKKDLTSKSAMLKRNL